MIKRIGWLIALVTITAIIAIPFLPGRYPQRTWRALKRQWLIATGGMYDVGGYYLRIECRGSGSSTVVFDSGLSQPRKTWGIVPGEVSKVSRVCTYDRAGVGESDRAGFVRTSEDVVRELRTLLEKSGEKAPFILVGHSFGGQNVRLFAARFPHETRSIVLVDPTHENEYQSLNRFRTEEVQASDVELMRGDNPEGLDLLTSQLILKNASEGPSVPATVLSSTVYEASTVPDEQKVRRELQLDIVRAVHSAHHQWVEGSSHFIQQDKPAAVIAAVRDLVADSQ
jgi:pimeloyl-ACP methyl ester carboxylesterase